VLNVHNHQLFIIKNKFMRIQIYINMYTYKCECVFKLKQTTNEDN